MDAPPMTPESNDAQPARSHAAHGSEALPLNYNDLVPPSNKKFPWKAEDWQLLCYYCNQPIYETKPTAGYRQRTLYMRGRWLHVDGDKWSCTKNLIRPPSEIDLPRCHVCGTQTNRHGGYCSVGGLPSFHATPMSQKEDEISEANRRAIAKPLNGESSAPGANKKD